jgi:CCR4-NOT transcription complex subunit 9
MYSTGGSYNAGSEGLGGGGGPSMKFSASLQQQPLQGSAQGGTLTAPAGIYSTAAAAATSSSSQMTQQYLDEEKVYSLILDLTLPSAREQALLELSKKREAYEGLAPILWHSFGVMTALLQEIISVYPSLTPPTLTGHASNRVCNALALLQCVASHNETRVLFLNAHIPLFLYPFLNTTSKTRPFEYLRLTSLGVIGALVKVCGHSERIDVQRTGMSARQIYSGPKGRLRGEAQRAFIPKLRF